MIRTGDALDAWFRLRGHAVARGVANIEGLRSPARIVLGNDPAQYEALHAAARPWDEELFRLFALPFPVVILESPNAERVGDTSVLFADLSAAAGLAQKRLFVCSTNRPNHPGTVTISATTVIGRFTAGGDVGFATGVAGDVLPDWSFWCRGDEIVLYLADFDPVALRERKIKKLSIEEYHEGIDRAGQLLSQSFTHEAERWLKDLSAIASPRAILVEEFRGPEKHRRRAMRAVEWTPQPRVSRRIIVLPARDAHALLVGNRERSEAMLDEDRRVRRCPHVRRRHYRMLRSEKFTHKRGQLVLVREHWVGPRERDDVEVSYRVILDR